MENALIANRYKPLFTRARGGFSEVVVAWDTKLTRRVAIKRIRIGRSLPIASLEEARTVAMLSSPNIVSVFDFEQTGNETLIIMENVDGPSLAELMFESTELLDIDVTTAILDGVVAALNYAHENQVLHLDIKPANILIDESGHIKVSDFGLAELAGSEGFGSGSGGTIGYMPPEQLTGSLVDTRTDLWALASLSYQLLTGANPFFGISPRDSLNHIMDGGYALPSELRTLLGGGVDEAIVRALSPYIDERQASVEDYWQEIRPYIGRIGPGRRRLKSLARVWAGKEAALLESTGDDEDYYDDDYAEDRELTDEEYYEEYEDEQDDSAIYDSSIEDQEAEARALEREEKRRSQAEEREKRKAERRKRRQERKPTEPLWQRLGPGAQTFIVRVFCALATSTMAYFALSALPFLSDPLAHAATAAAVSTSSPTPALLDTAVIARLVLTALAAIVTFIIPGIGSAAAALCFVLGFFFTGNWLVAILLLMACVAWWLFIGRHEMADTALFPLSSLLAIVSLPMLLPLLAGNLQNWRRALGTSALACFTTSLLALVTSGFIDKFLANILGTKDTVIYGMFSAQPLSDLLRASPSLMEMPAMKQIFLPLVSLFTSVEFWIILASWLCASVVMSLLNGGKSRVKYILVTLCGVGILAVGYLVPILFATGNGVELLIAVLARLAISFVICLIPIAVGATIKPNVSKSKGRAK